jgi:hypothetical protein
VLLSDGPDINQEGELILLNAVERTAVVSGGEWFHSAMHIIACSSSKVATAQGNQSSERR